MGRSFNGSSHYGTAGGTPSGPPLTLAGWFKPSGDGILFSVNNTATNMRFSAWRTGGNLVAVRGGGTSLLSSGRAIGTGAWHHFAVTIETNAGNHVVQAWVDGVADTSSSAGTETHNWSTFGLAARYSGGWGILGYGDGAFFAAWSAKLAAASIAELAAAFAPPSVLLSSLIDAWPLHGRQSPEPGIRGGAMSLFNSPSQAPAPRIIGYV